MIDIEFVNKVEKAHFRTVHDTGANGQAMLVWNMVREHVGLPRICLNDLPAYCETHLKYHLIKREYGCVIKKA